MAQILTVAAALLLAWSLTCLLDVEQRVITAAATLSPAITVLAVPIVALGVGRRRPIPAALAILAAALPWVLVAGYAAAGPGTTIAAGRPTLRIMTVDAAGGAAEAADVAAVSRSAGVDVLVVTGLSGVFAHDLTVAGLNGMVAQQVVTGGSDGAGNDTAKGTGGGIGIWSKATMSDVADLPGFGMPTVRGVLPAGSRRVGVVAAQIGGSPLALADNWSTDLARLPGAAPAVEDRVIVGDLGATPWHPAFRRLASHGWHDAADIVGRGLRPTWPAWSPMPIAPVDHVLVSDGLGVSSVETATVEGARNRALIVTVVLPANRD